MVLTLMLMTNLGKGSGSYSVSDLHDKLRRLLADAKNRGGSWSEHLLQKAAADALPGLLDENEALREQVAKEFYGGGVIAQERNMAEAERDSLKTEGGTLMAEVIHKDSKITTLKASLQTMTQRHSEASAALKETQETAMLNCNDKHAFKEERDALKASLKTMTERYSEASAEVQEMRMARGCKCCVLMLCPACLP